MGTHKAAASEAPQALDSLLRLFADCKTRRVRVCHWKSNSHLAAALHGDTDLDLLVHRDDRDKFEALLTAHDVKQVEAAPRKHYPGVENHLGMDPDSGRLFHLHVHYSLVLGQQHVKDFVLPLEDAFFDWTRVLSGVPVPAAALEYAVLATRAVLKYRLRDGLKDMLGVRRPGVPPHIQDELRWLAAARTAEDSGRAAELTRGVLPTELIEQVAELTAARRGAQLLWLRTRLRRGLRPYRRMGRIPATARYARTIIGKRVRRGARARRRMSLADGGKSIAIVGADGSGKSTTVAALEQWLGWRLTVRTLYMGTAQPSPRTAAAKWISKRVATLARRAGKVLPDGARMARLAARAADGSLAVRRVCEARDRLRRSERAQLAMADGAVVIYDRFPIPGIKIHGRSMDGARIQAEVPAPGRFIARLAHREQRLLAGVQPADVVIALHVDPEVSLERSPNHDPAAISAKVAAVATMERAAWDVVDIDANRPLDDVVRDMQLAVWSRL